MSTQAEALRLTAIVAMREAGYTQDDLQDLVTAAFEHLDGNPRQPYAFDRCTNCNRLIIG